VFHDPGNRRRIEFGKAARLHDVRSDDVALAKSSVANGHALVQLQARLDRIGRRAVRCAHACCAAVGLRRGMRRRCNGERRSLRRLDVYDWQNGFAVVSSVGCASGGSWERRSALACGGLDSIDEDIRRNELAICGTFR